MTFYRSQHILVDILDFALPGWARGMPVQGQHSCILYYAKDVNDETSGLHHLFWWEVCSDNSASSCSTSDMSDTRVISK